MLCLRRFSEALEEQFPDSEALFSAGLATRKELQLLESEADLGRVWHVPISWAMIMIRRLATLIYTVIFGHPASFEPVFSRFGWVIQRQILVDKQRPQKS